MDNKITRARLSNLISYDWVKIVAIIAAIALVWGLAFTIGAPRASVGQTFGLFTYAPDFGTIEDGTITLARAKNGGAFSYDVLDFTTRDLEPDYYSTIMTAANSVQEGDIFITSDFSDTVESKTSPMRAFVDGYYWSCYDYDSLINDAKSYALKNGVSEDRGSYYINEDRVAALFSSRMDGDPRFRDKKSEKYQKGLESEAERIKSVWNNACLLEEVLKAHSELRVNYKPFTQSLESLSEEDREKSDYYAWWLELEEKTYALNLGKLSDGKNLVTDYYSRGYLNDKGELETVSADGIVMCVFNYKAQQPHLQYETLGFINYIIGYFSNFLPTELSTLIA